MPTPHHGTQDHRAPPNGPRAAFPPTPGRAWLTELRLPPPSRHDHVIFLRGLPVAPWMTLRPWAEVWAVWLAHLEAIFAGWQAVAPLEDAREPAGRRTVEREVIVREMVPADLSWGTWRELHIHSVEASRVEDGLAALLPLLRRIADAQTADGAVGQPRGAAHLIGHSVGGAVIVAYLAGLRSRAFASPDLPVRAALTLDAAVSGLAGAWSGAKSYLHRVTGNHVMAEGLAGLNDWAANQGIRVLTASNHGDLWSHKRLADLPYLGVRLGSRLALYHQFNGTIHDWVRRTPEFVQAIWGPAVAAE